MPDYIICDNGEHRPMTDDEIAYWTANAAATEQQAKTQTAQAEAMAAAKASARAKLKALGLTDDEIAALLGE